MPEINRKILILPPPIEGTMKETNLLEGVGLTRGEIKVYYALLELGPSTTGEIIKKAKVSRSKVYEMLDRLLEKGLVSFVVKENVKYFEAASPNAIINYVQKKRKKLEEQETALKEILPKIKARQTYAKIRQSSTVFEGIAGIKTMYNEILSTLHPGDEYYAFAVEPSIYISKDFKQFIQNHHARRGGKKIRVKLIADEKIRTPITKSLGTSQYLQLRFIKRAFPAATLIYANNVATFVWGDTPTAMVMHSPKIAERYKRFFKELWGAAKP